MGAAAGGGVGDAAGVTGAFGVVAAGALGAGAAAAGVLAAGTAAGPFGDGATTGGSFAGAPDLDWSGLYVGGPAIPGSVG